VRYPYKKEENQGSEKAELGKKNRKFLAFILTYFFNSNSILAFGQKIGASAHLES
jgi:hypothetical protein